MPCKAVRRSVVSDQIWTVRNEPGNGDAGAHAGQSSIISGHRLSTPPSCIIMPNT